MTRYLNGVAAGSALLLILAAAIIPARGLQRKPSPRAKQVEELFNGNCARCHGADGRSQTPLGKLYQAPDFTDPEWWKKNAHKTSTRVMRATITRGKAVMPAFGKKLTKAEINLLLNHVRAFRTPK